MDNNNDDADTCRLIDRSTSSAAGLKTHLPTNALHGYQTL